MTTKTMTMITLIHWSTYNDQQPDEVSLLKLANLKKTKAHYSMVAEPTPLSYLKNPATHSQSHPHHHYCDHYQHNTHIIGNMTIIMTIITNMMLIMTIIGIMTIIMTTIISIITNIMLIMTIIIIEILIMRKFHHTQRAKNQVLF